MITINNITIGFSGTPLFENISFVVGDKDRIGLVGKNGAGKSTLLKLIAGGYTPETGEIVCPTDTRIGYLPQELISNSVKNIFDETLTAFDEINQLEKQIEKINKAILERTDYESESYIRLIEQLENANNRFSMLGGFNKESRAEKVLLGLGFERSDFSRGMSEFSGGWKMRVELAKLLLRQPNVILLDEPTNHLDIESIEWLENYLSSYEGSVILVSHDRAFLDNVTNRTVEITSGKIYDYKMSYSDYVIRQQERIDQQLAQQTNQQKQVSETEKFIERFRYKASKSKQVQSKIKMLEKMDKVEVDELDQSAISFFFPPAPHCGKVVLRAEKLTKSYGEKEILKNLEFTIDKGDKVAFVGKNGEGKTTLSKIIVRDTGFDGTCELGHQVKIGYYAQNQDELLNPDYTVLETIDRAAVGEIRKKIRNILGAFLFSDDDVEKKVKVLSGGEKSRLALAKLLLEPVNLLILDEPTNHLDMRSKDILKRALIEYDGTMIIVSHDRDFLQGLTNKVFEFKNKTIKQYIGDVSDFLESRRLQHLDDMHTKQANAQNKKEENTSSNKQSYELRKQFEKEIRKIKNKISKVEEEISNAETKLDEIQTTLSKESDQIDNHDIFASFEKQNQLLEEKMLKWESLNEELSEQEEKKENL